MYSFETRIRYTECDNDRSLSLTSLIDYFQDCSTFHSEDAGVGIDYISSRGEAWFLLNWQIIIDKMPVFADKVRVCTCPYDFKSFYGMRNFWLEDMEGNVLVKANSIWSYMDVVNARPKKIRMDDMEKYNIGEPISMDYAPRKMEKPNGLEYKAQLTVEPDMIDTNMHMNNAQYIRVAMNTFKDECKSAQVHVRQMLAEYKKSAKLGDIIRIYASWSDGKYCVDLRDTDDKTYAFVVFEQNWTMYQTGKQ